MSLPAAVRVAEPAAPCRLRFAASDGVTRLASASAGGPLRVVRATPGAPCEAVLVQTRGGMLAGDRWRVEVTLEPGAHVRLRAIGALVLHRGATAFRLRLSVGPRACLSWRSPGVIPWPGARARLHTSVDAAAGAVVTVAEAVRCDPASDVVLRTVVRRSGRVVLDDALRVDAGAPLPGRFGGASHAGSALLVGARRADLPRTPPPTVVMAAGRTPGGVTALRALGSSLAELDSILGELGDRAAHPTVGWGVRGPRPLPGEPGP